MVAHVSTVAYLGLEARSVEVQVQVAPGVPAFVVVGLPDKAVGESRERVRAALAAIGLALPPRAELTSASVVLARDAAPDPAIDTLDCWEVASEVRATAAMAGVAPPPIASTTSTARASTATTAGARRMVGSGLSEIARRAVSRP